MVWTAHFQRFKQLFSLPSKSLQSLVQAHISGLVSKASCTDQHCSSSMPCTLSHPLECLSESHLYPKWPSLLFVPIKCCDPFICSPKPGSATSSWISAHLTALSPDICSSPVTLRFITSCPGLQRTVCLLSGLRPWPFRSVRHEE